MKASTSSVFTAGEKNLITLPQESTKNFAKFQGITLAVFVFGSKSSLLFLKYTKRGCVFSPLTSTFSITGNSTLKFYLTNLSISAGEPLSCPKNWLHGNAKIQNPTDLHLAWALTISVQLSEVSPHLQATLVTIMSFLFRRFWKSKSLPLISLTLKSKNPFTGGVFSCSLPDLKISLAKNPPIIQQNK